MWWQGGLNDSLPSVLIFSIKAGNLPFHFLFSASFIPHQIWCYMIKTH